MKQVHIILGGHGSRHSFKALELTSHLRNVLRITGTNWEQELAQELIFRKAFGLNEPCDAVILEELPVEEIMKMLRAIDQGTFTIKSINYGRESLELPEMFVAVIQGLEFLNRDAFDRIKDSYLWDKLQVDLYDLRKKDEGVFRYIDEDDD